MVRLHNLGADAVEERLTLGLPVRSAWHVDLLEQRQDPVEWSDRELSVVVGPHRIVTLEVEFDR